MEMRTVLISTITGNRKVANDRLTAITAKARAIRDEVDWITQSTDEWRRFTLQPLSEEYVDLT